VKDDDLLLDENPQAEEGDSPHLLIAQMAVKNLPAAALYATTLAIDLRDISL
jgi:hypothetical protein